ncbi:rhomboid family intramembrane serine protease [Flavobacterium alkalisoli]|uniref:Rhomboid family intramembrane serine protease n=1 Tax=Flavobacterium alkalisoli TaxID=2602769 RepID=A0A5B9FMI8_9FLAO|nr:rhomboid family intramembrane serine protease [Flavobacterium alkalisoli]QEE48090.1 rhomboid family intramembrane serine protease [Flavobacterium alkalisoli]
MGILDDLKMEYRIGGITQRLIFWNVGLFAIPMVFFSVLSLFSVDLSFLRWDLASTNDWFSLSSNPEDLLWKPWSIISYMFLHAGIFHLLFNMMMLYFAGRLFLTFFTQKQMFGMYILGGVFAGFLYIVSYNLLPAFSVGGSKMVGASAAVMTVLIATAVYQPYYQVRLMLIGTVKLWHIAVVFVILDLIQASGSNAGGHIAHLGGALFGYIYIRLLQNGTDLSSIVTSVIDFFANLFKPKKKTPFKKVYKNNNVSRPASSLTNQPKDITQKRIDDILDKISKSGYESLTKEEKDFLSKAGK